MGGAIIVIRLDILVGFLFSINEGSPLVVPSVINVSSSPSAGRHKKARYHDAHLPPFDHPFRAGSKETFHPVWLSRIRSPSTEPERVRQLASACLVRRVGSGLMTDVHGKAAINLELKTFSARLSQVVPSDACQGPNRTRPPRLLI